MKTKVMTKELLIVAVAIAVTLSCFMLTKEIANGMTYAPGGNIDNVQELNVALGGENKIEGDNTVVLKDDVVLENPINISNAKASLTIDMAGHKMTCATENNQKWLIEVASSKLKITGKGIFEGCWRAIMLAEAGNVTIDSGTFKIDAVCVSAVNHNVHSHITINGGQLGGHSIYGFGPGTTNITINGGSVNEINLPTAEYGDHHGMASHKICVNGGTVGAISDGDGDMIYPTGDLYLRGGKIVGNVAVYKANITGGEISGDLYCYEKLKMTGGEISGDLCCYEKLKMTGGKIFGEVFTHGPFEMTGGKIISNQRYALHIEDKTKGVITGGIIKTTRKGAKGIIIKGGLYTTKLTVSGGQIVSENNNGSAGIYVYCPKVEKASYQGSAVVEYHAKKGKTAHVKGYKYGMYRKTLNNTKAKLSKYTRLKAPEKRKASYYAGQKLPRIIRGDITVKRTK